MGVRVSRGIASEAGVLMTDECFDQVEEYGSTHWNGVRVVIMGSMVLRRFSCSDRPKAGRFLVVDILSISGNFSGRKYQDQTHEGYQFK